MLLVQRQPQLPISITEERNASDIPVFEAAAATLRSLETKSDFKDKLSVLGQVLVKHAVTDKLAFHLTHRHWEIEHQEAAVMFRVSPTIDGALHQFSTVPSTSSMQKIPKTFRLVVKEEKDSEFVAYEYVDDSSEVVRSSYQSAFEILRENESLKRDLSAALLNTGLHTALSVTIDLPFLKSSEKQHIVSLEISDYDARGSDLYLVTSADADSIFDILSDGKNFEDVINTLFRFDKLGVSHVGALCGILCAKDARETPTQPHNCWQHSCARHKCTRHKIAQVKKME